MMGGIIRDSISVLADSIDLVQTPVDVPSETDYLLGIDANTYATLIVTISVFILGFVFHRAAGLLSKYLERRRIRKVFYAAGKEFVSESRKQSQNFFSNAESYRMDKRGSFEYKRESFFTHSSLRELGFEKSYAAFFLGIENWLSFRPALRRKAFMKIWSSLYSAEFWGKQSFDDMHVFIERYNEINERRNNSLEKHRQLVEDVILKYDGKTVSPAAFGKYIQGIDEIHVKWQQSGNLTRPDVVNELLVEPMLKLNKENHMFPISIASNNHLLPASAEYENQSNVLTAQRKQVCDYAWAFKSYARLCDRSLIILGG